MTKEKNRCTFSQLCSEWEESVQYQVKPSTYAVYFTMLEKHILPELGKYQVRKMNNRVVDQFLQDKQGQDLSWNTLRLIIFLLKAILHTGEDKGICTAEKIHYYIPKYKKPYMKVFDRGDAQRLISHLENSEKTFEMGLLISICTGIRVGELCGLKWGDVNWSRGTLQINRTVSRIRNPEIDERAEKGRGAETGDHMSKTIVYIGTPKTGTSIREIPLPDFLIIKMLDGKRGDSCYILSGTEKCMEPRGVQRRFKNLLRRCNIPDINIHALRHAFASKWIENGFDSKALSEILGHSSVKITMDIYVHSNMDQKKSYMNRMV